MRHKRISKLLLMVLAVMLIARTATAQPVSSQLPILVSPLVHAKAMPNGYTVPAMSFTGPSADGRRGSAGFVVQSQGLIVGNGTQWQFVFQRDPSGYGCQIIHPLAKGHILVNMWSEVTIHRGGSWSKIGWGNPASSDQVSLLDDGEILPLKENTPYTVVSQLSDSGLYRLTINDVLICEHQIKQAEPLVLEVPDKGSVWGGSGWDRKPFVGEDFKPRLKPGHAGLILAPMDGSGPRHFFKDIYLTSIPDDQIEQGDERLGALLQHIDSARELEQLTRSKMVGGSRGAAFVTIPDKPSLLVGFKYTTSTLYGGHLTIKSIRPIFRDQNGDSIGQSHGVPHGKVRQEKAKVGYVVAGIVAKSGHRIDGMRVIYMRIKNGRLNPDDTYRSKWIGGHGGGHETQSAANGDPIIGIYGRQGNDLDAIGFVQAPQ